MSNVTSQKRLLDLAPARWIWVPGNRCLPNTFALFRRTLHLASPPKSAAGWIVADSRYRLTVNGQRVQWGPAPSDPREQEADPLELTAYLQQGDNVIGVEVLYFGQGDGTWAMGAPGLLLNLEVVESGTPGPGLAPTPGPAPGPGAPAAQHTIVSDETWNCRIDRAHRPGQYCSWMLRALQEEFDARLHPHGWDTPAYRPDKLWSPARLLPGAAALPALYAGGPEQVRPVQLPKEQHTPLAHKTPPSVRKRSIPMMREQRVDFGPPVRTGIAQWHRPVADWFESRHPESFTLQDQPFAVDAQGAVGIPAQAPCQGAWLIYAAPEHMAGFPQIEFEAPEGTSIEIMTHDSFDLQDPYPWLDRGRWRWSRVITSKGLQGFETFDYESYKWMQIHIHGNTSPVTVRRAGMRRRLFAFPHEATIQLDDAVLQRVIDASVNTMRNSLQECNQDGGSRERQQYSGDVGHQQITSRFAYGPCSHSARYLQTYSRGITNTGYFMDCWPGVDRLTRIAQREMDATLWGPLIDHGVGFLDDCERYVMDTNRPQDLEEVTPRLLRFAAYLRGLMADDGLLPVENLGTPRIWIDTTYVHQRDKHCAFNLYVAGVLTHRFAPYLKRLGLATDAEAMEGWGRDLLARTIDLYWSAAQSAFVINQPTLAEDGEMRFCDRSLSTAVWFEQVPTDNLDAICRLLVEMPPNVMRSYPANALWRMVALARLGRDDVVVEEMRTRWGNMNSVIHNNALQEGWAVEIGSTHGQFSHCPQGPLYALFTELMGLKPRQPGFTEYSITPRIDHLPDFDITAHTAAGPFRFKRQREAAADHLTIDVPAGAAGEVSWLGQRKRVEGEASVTLSR